MKGTLQLNTNSLEILEERYQRFMVNVMTLIPGTTHTSLTNNNTTANYDLNDYYLTVFNSIGND